MFSSRAMQMSASVLRAQPAVNSIRARPFQMLNQARGFKTTQKLKSPVPKEEHSAHTISQRIRTLRKIPPELLPLGIVLAIAVGFAGYSLIRKLYTDGTLRLYRSRGHNQASSPADTKPSH